MKQYSQNMGILNQEEFSIIQDTRVLLIGAGGLGGYLANGLIRLGVKNLTIIDFDSFEESNLNRQIFATIPSLNKSKVTITKEKLLEINPHANILAIHSKYDNTIDEAIFGNIDIIFDGVDNIETKLLIEAHCAKYKKPLIHGAIGGWYGQIGIILPNSFILKDIYKNKTKGIEDTLKSPTFIPAIVGNMMISEFIKFILGKEALTNRILYIDVLDHEYRIIYKK
ncbi:MAG: ThiF family adenylyltransferase [Candidatus Izimaplasma sp.]|nr:ThiF family adenylyltransferase [Candidatus Izimaplasma bacterium]